ncbi:hypothetical protein [Rathayibacter iranicus]|uniref:Ig-like domain-containing protein n=1 Tax=Rathayibacter iranicus NCPPB 2253 = VKM Ac-1602 TaxID=1328868 RepID=A0ABX5LEY4_9MICO|nr:hypothetical protein [Rathayibacter iranicus]MWV32127.1 hypothetical protein [Rathayibacter iranicus NCPPB 2253 = VKM Ac-1602]PWJ61647.1 hypothetical protein B0H03_1153 [Rathayibacter iranicus NCPPB 2253 = VKM Ac-1602]
MTATPANAAVVGACTMKANNPHPSGHVSGRINTEGSMICTVGMTEIYIRAYLEKSNGASWAGDTESWLGTPANKTYSSFANAPCSEGPATFRTRVSYSFTSPPGVSPAYTSNIMYSPWIPTACGSSRSAQTTEASGAWTSDKALTDEVTAKTTPTGVELIFSFEG